MNTNFVLSSAKRLKWLATFAETTWRNNANGEEYTLPAMIKRGDFFWIGGQTGAVDTGDEWMSRCLGDVECIKQPHKELVDLLQQYIDKFEEEYGK